MRKKFIWAHYFYKLPILGGFLDIKLFSQDIHEYDYSFIYIFKLKLFLNHFNIYLLIKIKSNFIYFIDIYLFNFLKSKNIFFFLTYIDLKKVIINTF